MRSFSVTEIPTHNRQSVEQMGKQQGKGKMTCLKYPVMALAISLGLHPFSISCLSFSLQRKFKHSSEDEKSNLKKEDYYG